MTERRNGQEGKGPLTFEAREKILNDLLHLEKKVGVPLISDAEIEAIKGIWTQDRSVTVIRKADRMLGVFEGR